MSSRGIIAGLLIRYNPSIHVCWKGCDYAVGRVNDPKGYKQAEAMCKRYTSEVMWTAKGELGTNF
jgi:surface antigen